MLTVKSKDYLIEWNFLGNKLEKFPLAEFLGCFMSDLWHAWKCTERYVLLLSFAKHRPTFIRAGFQVKTTFSTNFCHFNEIQIQPNRKDKQRRQQVTWVFMNFFIFSGMCDVTVYSVKISSATKLCWAGSIGLLSKNDYEKPSNYSCETQPPALGMRGRSLTQFFTL